MPVISGGQLGSNHGANTAGSHPGAPPEIGRRTLSAPPATPATNGAGSGTASSNNAPARNSRMVLAVSQRKLTFLLALPAVLLLLPLFVFPFFGRRRYY
jgi:hypothetical protein